MLLARPWGKSHVSSHIASYNASAFHAYFMHCRRGLIRERIGQAIKNTDKSPRRRAPSRERSAVKTSFTRLNSAAARWPWHGCLRPTSVNCHTGTCHAKYREENEPVPVYGAGAPTRRWCFSKKNP